jgi:protein-S-isoprenylcysteine O-methyltransferase Ste14
MLADPFKYLFVVVIIAQEVIRFPHRMRNKRDRRAKRFLDDRSAGLELVLSLVALTGMEVIPLFYAFTDWLDFADYPLPQWLGWVGLAVAVAGLWLLYRAHADLGRNWSPSLQIVEQHHLVTEGVYRYLRHPIYASVWLIGLSQLLMLGNWIAGPAGLLAALLVQLVRIPREERMMLEHYGDAYRQYAATTGGIIPRIGG